jgi:hypothetical protein
LGARPIRVSRWCRDINRHDHTTKEQGSTSCKAWFGF